MSCINDVVAKFINDSVIALDQKLALINEDDGSFIMNEFHYLFTRRIELELFNLSIDLNINNSSNNYNEIYSIIKEKYLDYISDIKQIWENILQIYIEKNIISTIPELIYIFSCFLNQLDNIEIIAFNKMLDDSFEGMKNNDDNNEGYGYK